MSDDEHGSGGESTFHRPVLAFFTNKGHRPGEDHPLR